MFADVALACRIELAESRLAAALAGAADAPAAAIREVGGGIAALVGPGSPMNKIVGLGFAPLDSGVLAEVEASWREREEPVRIELCALADPDVLALLAARGYQLMAFENVLGLDLLHVFDAEPLEVGVGVERVRDGTLSAWASVAVDGFAAPDGTGAVVDEYARDVLEHVMADFARTPGMRRYLARYDGMPAGAASIRLEHGIAQLCGATTLPEYRRRGIQRALLAARIEEARAEGCELAVITTAPGSQSQANAQRRGFSLLYTRAVLIKGWS
jgi:ribosomal protein S18 acetylase RimI-like enzyme